MKMTNENYEILEKVNKEYDDLKEKYDRLDQFINSDKFYSDGVSMLQAQYLVEQRQAMKSYLTILSDRIEDFVKEQENDQDDDQESPQEGCDQKDSQDYFDFSEALSYIKNDYAVARKGWNGKNQSVYEVHFLDSDINDFLVLDHGDGNRDHWVPSTGDLMAGDWFIAAPVDFAAPVD